MSPTPTHPPAFAARMNAKNRQDESRKRSLVMNLSVVIPTRNRPQLLNEALQSVRVRQGPNARLDVEDASTPPVDGERLRSELEDFAGD